MVKKKEEKDLKRVYNVPLRRGFLKTPKWKRTKKAVKVLKEFLAKHMKTDIENVKIGGNLNESLWKHGIRNPPHHVKISAVKDKDGIVKAELEGVEYQTFKKVKKEKKGALGEMVGKLKSKDEEPKQVEKEKKIKTKDKLKQRKEQETKVEIEKEKKKIEEVKKTEIKEEKKPEEKKEEKTEPKKA